MPKIIINKFINSLTHNLLFFLIQTRPSIKSPSKIIMVICTKIFYLIITRKFHPDQNQWNIKIP